MTNGRIGCNYCDVFCLLDLDAVPLLVPCQNDSDLTSAQASTDIYVDMPPLPFEPKMSLFQSVSWFASGAPRSSGLGQWKYILDSSGEPLKVPTVVYVNVPFI